MKVLVILFFMIMNMASGQDFCAPPGNYPLEFIPVVTVDYERNTKASFCTRPTEMIDTIVLHHSESAPTDTAQDMNRYHLNRESQGDPWYMVGYSFVINSSYPGSMFPLPVVTEGRPINIAGSHAGSNAFVKMDKVQQKLWEEGKVVCGKEGGKFSVVPSQVRDGKIKANITTIGVVIVGNYAPYRTTNPPRTNPGGYPAGKPRYPTAKTEDMIARLSCQLQMRYPRIKSIKWHRYFNDTLCPGTIEERVNNIKLLTRKYGCEFN